MQSVPAHGTDAGARPSLVCESNVHRRPKIARSPGLQGMLVARRGTSLPLPCTSRTSATAAAARCAGDQAPQQRAAGDDEAPHQRRRGTASAGSGTRRGSGAARMGHWAVPLNAPQLGAGVCNLGCAAGLQRCSRAALPLPCAQECVPCTGNEEQAAVVGRRADTVMPTLKKARRTGEVRREAPASCGLLAWRLPLPLDGWTTTNACVQARTQVGTQTCLLTNLALLQATIGALASN